LKATQTQVQSQGNKTIIAVDTNMLLNIARFKVDFFNEAKKLIGKADFVLPNQIVEELQKLALKKGKIGVEAKIALQILAKKGIKTRQINDLSADDALLKLAEQCIIATNDRKLMASVKRIGGKVLFLRQRKFLQLKD
jgi:rRNA-processing protein FCF1